MVAQACVPMGRKKYDLPSEVFVPILRRYVNEYQEAIGAKAGLKESTSIGFGQASDLEGFARMGKRFHFASASQVLAEEAGVSLSVIYYHLQGKRQWISFEMVDRLLCAMGLTHLWFVEPLSDHYESIALAA